MPELLFCHLLWGSGIFAALTFLQSSAMAPYLSAYSCTNLMTELLFREIFGMLE
jgi:hypothetical protein